jgi:hypothetical protein
MTAGAALPLLKRARSEECLFHGEEAKRLRVDLSPPDLPRIRRMPPLSLKDTLCICKDTNIIGSKHGQGNWFSDDEIVKVHSIVSRTLLVEKQPHFDLFPGLSDEVIKLLSVDEPEVNVEISEHNKTVLQQQAVRGCMAAVTCMLAHDAGKPIDLAYMQRTNLGDDASSCRHLAKLGLTPMRYDIAKDLEKLSSRIAQYGSAIVTITDPQMGAHVVIVDSIHADSVRIREPYHGWEISIARKSLLDRLANDEIIQITQGATQGGSKVGQT